MGITIRAGKLFGRNPHDLERFLIDYAKDAHPLVKFQLVQCRCNSTVFLLRPENQCLIKCRFCGLRDFIRDHQEYSVETQIESFTCDDCHSEEVNIGIGCSSWDEGYEARWLYLGVRCPRCGRLEYLSGWESHLFPLMAFDGMLPPPNVI
jgi:hypothetical protein